RDVVYDIVVVDNGSDTAEAQAALADLSRRVARLRIIRDDRPFNWSALNNRAASHVEAEVVCFLNDDFEVLTDDWLSEMTGHSLRAEIGAVGARLWSPDATLQHAGIALNPLAGASHVHHRLPRGAEGHLARAVNVQNVSAVTGACLVVRKQLLEAVGGFDE